MKKLLAVLALTFTCFVCHAAFPVHYSGAWYDTKSITPGDKQAGQINFVFNADNTLDGEIFYDGEIVADVVGGTWSVKGQTIYVTFTDTDGWTWKGTVKKFFFSGTFVSPSKRTKGKWQANQPL